MLEDLESTRRQFLKLGGNSLILSLVLGTGLVSLSKPAFTGNLKVLTERESTTLLSVVRTLFPHDWIDDGYYMNVVAAIDDKCAGDEKVRNTVREGVAKLNSALGGSFAKASESARVNALKTEEKSEFFQLAYGETLTNFYGNHAIWKMFGYEGSSVEQGGYLDRGFDDIDWLPKS